MLIVVPPALEIRLPGLCRRVRVEFHVGVPLVIVAFVEIQPRFVFRTHVVHDAPDGVCVRGGIAWRQRYHVRVPPLADDPGV